MNYLKDVENNVILSELSKSISKYIDYILEKTRPLNISIDEKINLIKISLTLQSIVNNEDLLMSLINTLLETYTNRLKNTVLGKSVNTLNYTSSMHIVDKIRDRRKIAIREIIDRHSSHGDILDYIWLRKHGYLKKMKDGRLIVDHRIKELKQRVEQRTLDFNDVFTYIREIPSNLWNRVIDQSMIDSIDNCSFLEKTMKIFGYNVKIDEAIIKSLDRRLKAGWKPFDKDLDVLKDTVSKWRVKGYFHEYTGPYSLLWIDHRIIDERLIKRIVKDIKTLPLKHRWKLLKFINDKPEFHKILDKLDPVTLSSIGSTSRYPPSLQSKILMGQAIVNYVNYLLTLDTAYLEYSQYILSSIDPSKIPHEFKPLYKSIISNNYRDFLKFINRDLGVDILEYIAYRTWDIFSQQGFNNDVLNRAIGISYSILRRSLKGFEYEGRYRVSNSQGKVLVKKTIYNFIRGNYRLVRRMREKQLKVIAVVDVSGSMLKYSLWTIISLAYVISIVKTIILFRDNVYVYKPPRRVIKPLIIKFLQILFHGGFHGYTNISLAIRSLKNVVSSNDIVLLFTDLEQTVKDSDPWVEAKDLVGKCRGLIVFVPIHHRFDVADRFREIGADVIIVDDVSKLPRLLRWRLNLKIW